MENYDPYFEQGSLIFKHLNGRLTEQEKEELDRWIQENDQNKALFARLTDEHNLVSQLNDFSFSNKDEAWERIVLETGFRKNSHTSAVYRSWLKYAAAAILLIISGVTLFKILNTRDNMENQIAVTSQKPDLLPGKNKAVLTLADGSEILLDEVSKGQIARQENILITKTDDGQLVYTLNKTKNPESGTAAIPTFNNISTPRGGQYKVILPDGSKVWLNAASTLKYPTEFSDTGRKVELKGEAYFEIAKAEYIKDGRKHRIPFLVLSAGQSVEVLGTRFNVNSYANERNVTTTLVEGSVRVISATNKTDNIREKAGHEIMLRPGEQSRLSLAGKDPVPVVSKADMDEVIAWKNGEFQFKNADIQTIMRQISRWYDVEVEFQGKIPDTKYRGKIPRNVPVSQLFEILQTSGVNFKIEGRKIIVRT